MSKHAIPAIIALSAATFLMAGCSSDADNFNQEVPITISYSIGGTTVLERPDGTVDENVPLSGVTVTLTDILAAATTAVTTTEGIWAMSDVDPGAYQISYEKTGFVTAYDGVQLQALGETNIANLFYSIGDQALKETPLSFTTNLSGTAAVDKDTTPVVDGFGGVTSTWDQSSAIEVTFSQAVDYANTTTVPDVVCLYDPAGNAMKYDSDGDSAITAADDDLCGSPNSAHTVFTIASANLLLGGNVGDGTVDGLTADADPFTQYSLRADVISYSDVYGDALTLVGNLYFNVNSN